MISKKKAGWLLAGALSLVSSIANAEMLTFHFKGTVIYGGTLANVGDEITGHFCYDTDAGPPAIRLDNFAYYQVAPECKLVVRVGTHKATTGDLGISIWNNFGGNVEDMMDVSGAGAVVDGTEYPNGTVNFQFATASGNTKIFRSVNLRERFRIEDFDAWHDGVVLMDGSQTGTLLQFTITSIRVVD
jgi:hypothetical protein